MQQLRICSCGRRRTTWRDGARSWAERETDSTGPWGSSSSTRPSQWKPSAQTKVKKHLAIDAEMMFPSVSHSDDWYLWVCEIWSNLIDCKVTHWNVLYWLCCGLTLVWQCVDLVWSAGSLFNRAATIFPKLIINNRRVVSPAEQRRQIWWWLKAWRNRQDRFYHFTYTHLCPHGSGLEDVLRSFTLEQVPQWGS